MERYSLIVVTDETAPIRRFDIRKDLARRAIWGAAIAVCVAVVGLVDYIRVRIDHVELQALRVETAEQKAKIDGFDETLSAVEAKLDRLRDFERKVRIIANLPGAVATGGEEVTAIGSAVGGDLEATAKGAGAVAVSDDETEGDEDPEPEEGSARPEPPRLPGTPNGDRVSVLRQDAERLGLVAGAREMSLAELLEKLESKRDRLASTPAIWPTKGWMTSRFGNRISPFTGGLQFHAGIDIAGASGTDVIAPARGRVVFSGTRGPLGRTVVIDHGNGIRTVYGHVSESFVKRGQQIERRQVIASLGNTGRSTGPHLHYAVEVKGKAVNPLDYIFD